MLDLELLDECLSPGGPTLLVDSFESQAIHSDVHGRLARNLALRDRAPLGVRDSSCPFRWHYFSAPNSQVPRFAAPAVRTVARSTRFAASRRLKRTIAGNAAKGWTSDTLCNEPL